MELPELPEPKMRRVELAGRSFLTEPIPGMLTFAEVRAYGLECVRLAVEATKEQCAMMAERQVAPLRGNSSKDHIVADCTAHNIAAAIRAGFFGASIVSHPEYKQEQADKNAVARGILDKM